MSYKLDPRVYSYEVEGGALARCLDAWLASEHRLETLPIERRPLKDGDAPLPQAGAGELLLILTDSEALQRRAVRLKLARRAPTVVLRWWDAPAGLARSYRNRLVFNRYTGINLLPSRAMLEANARAPLPLDNSVLLDQPELGADAPLRMLRHVLQALTQPARRDVFGRDKRDHGHLRLCVATHFYFNQNDIATITSLLEHYASYPADLLDRLQFVVVDDGSPIRYEIPEVDLNLTWLRVDQDIRWNQAGARNLAMVYARSNNVVISDVDHSFPEPTLRFLAGRDAPHRRFYKFHRRLADGRLVRGHPNIFYLARARWFELYGTDEEFSGAYGAEDFRFVKNFKNHGTLQSHLPRRYPCDERALDRTRSYHSLVRDLSFNTPLDTRKRMEADYFGADYGHSRSSLGFTWTLLADRQRASVPAPPLDRAWRPAWWLRSLSSLLVSLL